MLQCLQNIKIVQQHDLQNELHEQKHEQQQQDIQVVAHKHSSYQHL
jgi:hypothetical protein